MKESILIVVCVFLILWIFLGVNCWCLILLVIISVSYLSANEKSNKTYGGYESNGIYIESPAIDKK